MLKKNVHIGPIIRKVVEDKKMTITEFARQCGFAGREYAYTIFNSKTISTDMLIDISKVLNYNFLLEYFEEKPVQRQILIIETDSDKIDKLITQLSNDKYLIIRKLDDNV
ncbi:MAG: hypothetical protein LBE91_10625 [Tannerella sp.]|jgi:transcriptional regulator with XRE-family HTH domain|nr:hypothetical protein [Tannerella sp.]